MKRSGVIFTLGQGTLRLLAFVAGLAGMVGLMIVLPLLESITSIPPSDLMLQSVATANVPPLPVASAGMSTTGRSSMATAPLFFRIETVCHRHLAGGWSQKQARCLFYTGKDFVTRTPS